MYGGTVTCLCWAASVIVRSGRLGAQFACRGTDCCLQVRVARLFRGCRCRFAARGVKAGRRVCVPPVTSVCRPSTAPPPDARRFLKALVPVPIRTAWGLAGPEGIGTTTGMRRAGLSAEQSLAASCGLPRAEEVGGARAQRGNRLVLGCDRLSSGRRPERGSFPGHPRVAPGCFRHARRAGDIRQEHAALTA